MNLIGNLFEPGTPDEEEKVRDLLARPKSGREASDIAWCLGGLGMPKWLRMRSHYLSGSLRLGQREGLFGA